ncbi:AaceriAGL086Cp [[Ashbya] aceris (nom. inval.)]|nr:AaceriAGL086Cp [[Ashbya] aceris (nom. inval.)]
MARVPIADEPQASEVVPETINAALDQLHLDDLGDPKEVAPSAERKDVGAAATAGPSSMPIQPNGLFPPPPHPQMMNPFLPYPLMHIPHHNGFFPPGDGPIIPLDSSAAGDFSNAIVPTPPQTSGLDVVPEPLWSASQDYQFMHGYPFADAAAGKTGMAPVAAAAGSSLQDEDQLPRSVHEPGVAHRRQTFTAIPNPELLNVTSAPPAALAGSSDHPEEKAATEGEIKEGEFNSPGYPQAAYPYGGPLLQPNPVLPGHPPPTGPGPNYGIPSPFPGYGFTSPFSPVPGTSPLATNQQGKGIPPPNGNGTSTSIDGANGWMYPPHGNHPFPAHLVPHPQILGGPSGSPHYLNGPRSRNNHNGKRGHTGGHQSSHGGGAGAGDGHKYRNGNHHHHHHHNRADDAARYADAKLEDYIGKLYSLCKDQHGCRFLQRQLDVAGPDAATSIFEETKQYVVELMTDSFGNYLIQKLVERVTTEQRITLVKSSADQFVSIALDPHGTRALQKLVECICSEEESRIIIASLKNSVVQLSKDLNGNHVVQKCLQKFSPADSQFIFDAACADCVKIATHRHGCCVLQRCLDYGSDEQRDQLCAQVLANVDVLTLDPFGNYVVQYILTKEAELPPPTYTAKIVAALKPRIIELSLHKFGSNVVEKILRTPAVAELMISELLATGGQPGVEQLLHDGFGNYVLQTALDVSKTANSFLYTRLTDLLKPALVGPIRNTPHGRRIMSILQLD